VLGEIHASEQVIRDRYCRPPSAAFAWIRFICKADAKARVSYGLVSVRAPEQPLSDGVVALRFFVDDDVPAIAAACAEAEIARWLDQIPQPYTKEDARAYLDVCRDCWRDGSMSTFAITDAATGELLGSIGVRQLGGLEEGTSEVGYWVKREARGHGAATRALRLVSAWALAQPGIERLQLRADVENRPSQRVAENAGFRREGVLRSARYNARLGRRADFVLYSLLPGDRA
jgi:RimJ/RimL family protein N-acetyltransferase